MPERSDDRPPPPRADATRDIRLPPIPGRPGPDVPPEWSSYVPSPAVPAQHSVDEPTDHLAGSSDHPLRQGTRSFPPRIPVRPLAVSVTPRRRRTTTVLWTLILLTLAVIVACGIYLLVVVNGR
jgi:hypothetical protein